MPIRFRCAYCNQLLGIAHRKAGTVVRCPTCAGQVVVPHPEEGANEPGEPAKPMLFERSDFDEVLRGNEGRGRPAERKQAASRSGDPAAFAPPSPAPPHPAPWQQAETGLAGEADIDVERVPESALPVPTLAAPSLPGGVVFSSRQMLLLTLAGIVAILLAFGAGLIVGLSLRPAPRSTPPEETASLVLPLVRATVVRPPGGLS